MMKKILVLILMCFSMSMQSQKMKVGVKGGLSLPSLTDNTNNIYTENFYTFPSYEGGAFIQRKINDRFAIQIEANYTVKGGVRDEFQPIPKDKLVASIKEEAYALLPLVPVTIVDAAVDAYMDSKESAFYADFYNRSELEYVEVPVLLNIGFGEEWRFYANVGPYVGFLLSATQITKGESQIYEDKNMTPISIAVLGFSLPIYTEIEDFTDRTDVTEEMNSISYGGVLALGVTKQLWKNSEVFFEAKGNYAFVPLQKNETYGSSKIGSIVLELGYAYKF